ncbi:hypothetical protein [Ralstonia phage phiRSL1]|uniref:Uncharacterized protein n=1 Tax=Ralstonia phage phiRSL1 TaxID=1980924 RepID=B2ZY55_9CAUD|nr:hypothetical protein RSL1_ORF175 [Ralstonia phage phiRSL1]BAG41623.1 hypothetical protein [Ralstonia phage phiRSL1]
MEVTSYEVEEQVVDAELSRLPPVPLPEDQGTVRLVRTVVQLLVFVCLSDRHPLILVQRGGWHIHIRQTMAAPEERINDGRHPLSPLISKDQRVAGPRTDGLLRRTTEQRVSAFVVGNGHGLRPTVAA